MAGNVSGGDDCGHDDDGDIFFFLNFGKNMEKKNVFYSETAPFLFTFKWYY